MKKWLIDRFASSTFNKYPYQQLTGMTGPPMRIHVDPDAKPVAYHTPLMVPIHWQDEAEQRLKDGCSSGTFEKPPTGESVTWCH